MSELMSVDRDALQKALESALTEESLAPLAYNERLIFFPGGFR